MTRRRLSWLLALLLSLQSGLAAAHCLGRAGAPADRAVVICTPSGLRSVALPADHGEPAAPAVDGFCPACHALPTVLLPEAPALPTPAWASAPSERAPFAAEVPRPRPRARDPTRGPRGPPFPT